MTVYRIRCLVALLLASALVLTNSNPARAGDGAAKDEQAAKNAVTAFVTGCAARNKGAFDRLAEPDRSLWIKVRETKLGDQLRKVWYDRIPKGATIAEGKGKVTVKLTKTTGTVVVTIAEPKDATTGTSKTREVTIAVVKVGGVWYVDLKVADALRPR